jgi:hypothetical protein
MSSKHTETHPAKPFNALGTDGGAAVHLSGFQVLNPATSARLSFVSDESGRVCCVSVTNMDTAEGHHIFLTTEAMRELVIKFSILTEEKLANN